MAKDKNAPRFDNEGVRKVMRTKDYLADFSGQFALGLMANLVGQLTYFYTDKAGVAVGAVGIIMAIAKVIDAFTDVIAGHIIDRSKGGDHKYYKWMLLGAFPAALITFLMFTVPKEGSQFLKLAYILVTNLLLTAVIFTLIATAFSAVMVVRTHSQSERGSMGVWRAVGNYGAGMIISIITIPVTNMLGGTQEAWIKYGAILALLVLLCFGLCLLNGRKAKFASDYEKAESVAVKAADAQQEAEEEKVPFAQAMGMLIKNKYWVLVLLFNLITSVTNGIAAAAGTYYCKWIFGDDNLVAVIGGVGLAATILGFALSKLIISKLGVKKTVLFGLAGAAAAAAVRIFLPEVFGAYVGTSLFASFVQIPMMCLYGVLTAMVIDYNEWKYGHKLVAMSGGAIGFGSKVGNGLGSILLSVFLTLGAYDATLAVATDSMRNAIFGFSNYMPVVINLLMFFLFLGFDLEQKLPQMREEVAARKAAANH